MSTFFSPVCKNAKICNLLPNTETFGVDFYILFNFSLSWTFTTTTHSTDASFFTDLIFSRQHFDISFRFKSIVGIGVGAGAYILAKFAVSHVTGLYCFFFFRLFFFKYYFRRLC